MDRKSLKSILVDSGLDTDHVYKVAGKWPATMVLANMASGTLERQLPDFYDVFIPTRPMVLIETSGDMRRRKFRYRRGMVGFSPPGATWSIEWVGQLEGISFFFSPDVINRFAERNFKESPVDLTWRSALSDNMPAIAHLGMDIASQVATGVPMGKRFVQNQTSVFLSMLLRRYSYSPQRMSALVGVTSPQVLRAVRFIDLHLTDPISSALICEYCAASGSHLNRLFREELGQSLWDFVLSRRLDAAAGQLRKTAAPIAQIGRLYQFRSRSSFSRQFSQRFDCSPSEHRRSANRGGDH